VLKVAGLEQDSRFNSPATRVKHAAELDRLISRWTSTQDQYHAEALLQAAGVPSSAVQNSPELARDPQLAYRCHFVQLKDPARGTSFVEASAINLSLTPVHQPVRPQPSAATPNRFSTTCWATPKTRSPN